VFNGYFFNFYLPISFGYVGYVHKFVELDVVKFVNATDMYSVRMLPCYKQSLLICTRQT
jgi:hypothetical protein